MQDPELVEDCIEAMQAATTIPVTVKCRIGVNDRDDINFLNDFVSKIINPNLKTIIVHARVAILKGLTPRQNRQIPPLKYENVYQLKKEFPQLEIVINGGIKDIDELIYDNDNYFFYNGLKYTTIGIDSKKRIMRGYVRDYADLLEIERKTKINISYPVVKMDKKLFLNKLKENMEKYYSDNKEYSKKINKLSFTL